MNEEQLIALGKLRAALEQCHDDGLRGGVYDGSFCVWRADAMHPCDVPVIEFFDYVNRVGVAINTRMTLDGGAGV